MTWDFPGIHGNRECTDCGACCVYFSIQNNDGSTFKEAGDVCMYLESVDGQSRCTIYDSVGRPDACDQFTCTENSLVFFLRGDHWTRLRDVASRMDEILEGENE